ncbi:ABC-2 type transport system permease protein [Micromonospora nigra]|uniref:ABC-2 type transport system permease protein n=1 Tax=Micromonospora nigra TaxID=145857 RepID=A0A1C6S7A6_9ACTN|nr:polyketide antibiotic transporter [Micromonospora nigra]SCL25271.1 ABC-2 type transport system permease protein [Micromonospora nigra]
MNPGRAVTRLTVRQVRRGTLVVLAVTAGMSALVVTTYHSALGGAEGAAALAALAANPAIRTLFGEPVALDTAGGFTVWRTGTVLAVLLSVWGMLAATRISRGEEDAGRWDLLLAGRLTPSAVIRRQLGVLTVAVAGSGTAVTGALALSGTPLTGAALHGAGLALAGAFGVAVALLTAQVLPTRAGATGAATAVLGVALLLRMVGDGIGALGWLRWLSPYGLLALTRPYLDDRVAPLLVLGAGTAAVAALALVLAGRRDLRAGLLAPTTSRPPRRWLLGSVEAFALRRLLRPLTGWAAGIGAYFLLIGLLAESLTAFLADNPLFAEAAAEAGFAGLVTVRGYAATLFALLAVPVGIFAALRLADFGAAEADRRLTSLHAQPLRRGRLLAAEVVAALAGAAVLLTAAGTLTWLGATIVDAGLSLPAALAGAWNVLPVVLLALGAAVLALGWTPRAVAAVGALPGAGGFLLKVTAESAGQPEVGRLSPFAHLAAVPSTGPNWPASLAMAGVAVAVAALGWWGYHRRDLRG